jgi:hypothetical protein
MRYGPEFVARALLEWIVDQGIETALIARVSLGRTASAWPNDQAAADVLALDHGVVGRDRPAAAGIGRHSPGTISGLRGRPPARLEICPQPGPPAAQYSGCVSADADEPITTKTATMRRPQHQSCRFGLLTTTSGLP